MINEDIKGWTSVAKCIAKHTTNIDVSGVVEELTKKKHVFTRTLRNPIKKLGTIYQKKGANFIAPKAVKIIKSKAEDLNNIKHQAIKMRRRLDQSKYFLNSIS